MRTINIFVEMDADRTEQLGIPELAVIKGKGDTYHFYTVKQMSMMYNCPFCGSPSIKNQGMLKWKGYQMMESPIAARSNFLRDLSIPVNTDCESC